MFLLCIYLQSLKTHSAILSINLCDQNLYLCVAIVELTWKALLFIYFILLTTPRFRSLLSQLALSNVLSSVQYEI